MPHICFSHLRFFRYLKFLGKEYHGYLLPSCQAGKPNTPNPKKNLSYDASLANLREILDCLGYEGSQFGEHSMKRGMATHCSDVGKTDSEIQVAGDWKSIKTAQKYIDKKAVQTQNFIRSVF